MDNDNRKPANFFEEHFESFAAADFHEDSPKLASIGYKLFIAPYVVIVCALIIALICRNTVATVIAAVFIVLSVLVILKVRDFKTMDIYEKALVIYTDESAQRVVRIPYEDIKEWDAQNDPVSRIKLITNDGLTVYKNTFQLDKASRYLYSIMGKKETGTILREQVRDRKISITEFFNRLFSRDR